MSIKETNYRKWKNAYEITSGDAKLVVVTDIGPRVMSLTLGHGPNLLFDDLKEELKFKGWKIYGGHRFWVSPETLPTYAPDNMPCQAWIEGGSLVVTAPSDPAAGYEKSIAFSPAKGGFAIRHTLRNGGPFLTPPGAIWALTCARPTGVCAIPWQSGPDKWRVATIKMWAAWADHGSDLESRQWKPTKDLYQIHPTGEEGKIGTYADRGWLGQWTDEATFIKKTKAIPGATYPDGGCNIELYTCSHFIELETLSPMATLGPGESIEHEERWFVSKPIEMSSKAVEKLIGE